MRNLLVWDGLISWRDDLLKKDVLKKSKMDYLSNMTKLIEVKILDLEQPLSEFIKTRPEDSLNKLDKTTWSHSTKLSRRNLFRSFYNFVQKKKIKQANIEFSRDISITELLSSNEDKAKLLKTSEIVRFTRELCNMNARDSLICWMMWEFQSTIHQILNICINDIDFAKDIIKFKDGSILADIRPDLKPCILAQIREKSGTDLLFSTEHGKGIHPGQIVRNMKIASKRARLPFIFSPKLLYADARAYAKRAFLSLPEDERKKICLKMATKD